jgi:hypothetical protein
MSGFKRGRSEVNNLFYKEIERNNYQRNRV